MFSSLSRKIISARVFSPAITVARGCAGAARDEHIKRLLSQRFPAASSLSVTDVSGGCGAMFEVCVEAPDFAGLSVVKQHRLVTQTLAAEIADMHGIRIFTAATRGGSDAGGSS